jgi:dTDP-glucose 4,6-dehydratase
MKYVITGGAGFIGSNLVHLIKKRQPAAKILILDKLGVGSDPANVAGLDHVDLLECNLTDYERVEDSINEFKPDRLIHLAAESHVDRSITSGGSKEFIRSNVIGTHSVLEALTLRARKGDNVKSLFVSTDEVYGSLNLEEDAFTEDLKHKPSSVYSASKSAGEALVHAYVKTQKLDIVITNCSNNYGPRQHEEKLIPKVIKNLLHGEEVGVYGDGSNIRDWIHVDDHNDALLKVLNGGLAGQNYNIGANNEVTNLQLIEKITEVLQSHDMAEYMLDKFGFSMPMRKLKFVEDRLGHDFRYAINNSKMLNDFSWKPKKKFNEAIIDTVKWYVDKYLEAKV